MTLTKQDINEIANLIDERLEASNSKLEALIDEKLEINNSKLIALFFKHFPTKEEVNEMMDRKLEPIKDRLGIVEDIVSDIKLQIDRERIPFIESTLDTTQNRVGKLEKRVDNIAFRLTS